MTTANGTVTATIGIADENLTEVSLKLSKILADEYVLYTKTKNFHWNVQGINFIALHLFFDELAEEIENNIDLVAERVRSLGHFPAATLKEFLELTNLLESSHDNGSAKGMIQALVDDHETIIGELRREIPVINDKYKDLGTADLLTQIIEKHELLAWKLRAHLG